MTGTRKSNVPDVYPMAKHPKNKRAESLKFRPFSVGPAGLEPASRCSFGVFSLVNDFDVKMNRNPSILSNCSRSSRYAYIENKDDATEIRSPARIVRTRSSLTNAVLLSINPESITPVQCIRQNRQAVAEPA